jgi:hypothetical protein
MDVEIILQRDSHLVCPNVNTKVLQMNEKSYRKMEPSGHHQNQVDLRRKCLIRALEPEATKGVNIS